MPDYTIFIIGVFLAVMYAFLGKSRPAIALVSCPFPAAVLFYYAVADDSLWALAACLLFVLAALLSVLLVTPKRESSTRTQSFVKFFFCLLGTIAYLFVAFSIFGPYGFFLLAMAAALIVRYNLISRDTITTHVLSTIGASMRQNLPLPAALQSEAQGQKGRRRRILERISHWLTQGYPLSESLRRGYSKCPGYALAMIGAAERIQQVPRALASIEKHLAQRSRESRTFQPVSLAYPLVLMILLLSVMGGMMIVVVPKFVEIFKDLGQQLPPITRGVLLLSGEYAGLIFVLLAILVFLVVPSALYLKFRPRRPDRPYLTSRIGDFFKWHFPVLHWFERNFSLLQTVSFLRLSINTGNTVDQAIGGAVELDANTCYRRRLGRWLDKVQRGQDIAEAARKSRVGSAIAWAFDQKINQGNTPAILESLESSYRSNYGYITNLARFIFWPCVTILMAVIVGLVVYAMFAPIAAMIHHTIDVQIP